MCIHDHGIENMTSLSSASFIQAKSIRLSQSKCEQKAKKMIKIRQNTSRRHNFCSLSYGLTALVLYYALRLCIPQFSIHNSIDLQQKRIKYLFLETCFHNFGRNYATLSSFLSFLNVVGFLVSSLGNWYNSCVIAEIWRMTQNTSEKSLKCHTWRFYSELKNDFEGQGVSPRKSLVKPLFKHIS